MKLMFFDDFKLGVVKGDNVVDVSAVVKDIPHTSPNGLMVGLIERFDAYRPKLEAAVAGAAGVPFGTFAAWVSLGKLGRYIAVALAVVSTS